LRAKAAKEKIELSEFARVLLLINKKRGYKSSRKAKNEDEGQIIDGMAVAKKLYEENITPGEYSYQLLQQGKNNCLIFTVQIYRLNLIKYGIFRNNIIQKS
jgi:CRISPR-associated endonuclease Csn1